MSVTKMNDSSIRHTLTLTIYKDMGSNKIAFFTVFILYLATVVINISLMLILYLEPSLHKPMYTFIFCLILNGLIGSTAVWPHAMFILLTDLNITSYVGCFVQYLLVGRYGSCNFTVLTVMAYDRFLSIFQPLQYHTIMTTQRVKLLLIFANCLPTALVLIQVFLVSQMPICKYTVHRLFCDYFSISRLLCGANIFMKIASICNLFLSTIVIFFPMILILLSYIKIIKLILKCSKSARRKVFETCSPHFIIFVQFSFVTVFSTISNHTHTSIPLQTHIFMAMIYILFPPLLQPIIYGLKTEEIRRSICKVWKRKVWSI